MHRSQQKTTMMWYKEGNRDLKSESLSVYFLLWLDLLCCVVFASESLSVYFLLWLDLLCSPGS